MLFLWIVSNHVTHYGTRSHFPLHNLAAPIKRTSPNRYMLWGLSLGNRYQYPDENTIIIMTKLRHLCLFVYCGVQHILLCVFVLLFFFHLVYPMLPGSLDWPFLIGPLVFSNVYLSQTACLQCKLNNTLYYFACHVFIHIKILNSLCHDLVP